MSNIISIKHGAGEPSSEQLEKYELGYSTDKEALYINNNGQIKRINRQSFTTTITLTNGKTEYDITSTLFNDDSVVFIDVDSTNIDSTDVDSTVKDIIQAFRKADLIQKSYDENEHKLTLKALGVLPSGGTTIPIKVTIL